MRLFKTKLERKRGVWRRLVDLGLTDVRVLAERGSTVGHCPYKYAKMGITFESFARYRARGINIALGTDTHMLDHLGYMELAVATARRGWVEARHVLNTRPIGEIRARIAAKRGTSLPSR